MTREEKCELAIERGYTYDPETGIIYNKFNKIVKNKLPKKGYIRIESNIHLLAHHFAWYCVYNECVEEIDHINGIRDDNRICNLRSVTKQQNQWNRLTAKGYSWNIKEQKWKSRITLNNKEIHLGYFNTEEEARNAYLQAKEIYHKF
jgi:hypothetical protein